VPVWNVRLVRLGNLGRLLEPAMKRMIIEAVAVMLLAAFGWWLL
jgi:hypothetical protein